MNRFSQSQIILIFCRCHLHHIIFFFRQHQSLEVQWRPLPANVVNSHIRLSTVHFLPPSSYCSQLGPAPCYNIYKKRYVRTTPCPVLSVCLAVAICCPVLFASTASCIYLSTDVRWPLPNKQLLRLCWLVFDYGKPVLSGLHIHGSLRSSWQYGTVGHQNSQPHTVANCWAILIYPLPRAVSPMAPK